MVADDTLVKKARKVMVMLRELDISYDISRKGHDNITLVLSTPFLLKYSRLSYIVISNGLLPGLSYNISMTAVLSQTFKIGKNISSISAFLQQLSLTLAPFYFIFDFDSMQVLIRQSSLYSDDVNPNPDAFLGSISLLASRLAKPLGRLEVDYFSQQDARLMADLFAENCYKVMDDEL